MRRFPLYSYTLEEEKRTKETLRKCKAEMKLYRLIFNRLYKEVTFLLQYSGQKWFGGLHVAFNLNMYRILGLLQSMKLLTLRGYYYETSILERNFYECIGLCVYLKRNPEKAEIWNTAKKVEGSLRLSTLVGEIFKPLTTDDKKRLEKSYGLLSNYVHNNLPALLSIISDLEAGEKIIEGKTAKAITIQYPSSFNHSKVVDLATLPFVSLYALRFLYDDILPQNRKAEISRFLAKQTPKLLALDGTLKNTSAQAS